MNASVNQPKVSIVILNWNSYDVTRDCLLSLRKLDYPNFEVLLVDNASVDSSADKLEQEFPEVRVLRNADNLGFTGGNNVGVRDALRRGTDYLLLLNNDTIVAPDFLARLMKVAESSPQIGILNPKIYYFEPPDSIWYAGGVHKPWWCFPVCVGRSEKDVGAYNQIKEVSFITGCALLIKANVVEKVGLLDEVFFLGFEDIDWTVRVLQAGFKAVYVPESVIWHRESYTTKKNVGRIVRDYYGIRNSILFARKHVKARYWPLFLLSLAQKLGYMTAGYLSRTQFVDAGKLLKGVWSGCVTKLPSQTPS